MWKKRLQGRGLSAKIKIVPDDDRNLKVRDKRYPGNDLKLKEGDDDYGERNI